MEATKAEFPVYWQQAHPTLLLSLHSSGDYDAPEVQPHLYTIFRAPGATIHRKFSYLSFVFMPFNLIVLPSYLFVDSITFLWSGLHPLPHSLHLFSWLITF